MSRGCLISCLNIICLMRKKQSKKQQHNPVKTEDVVEPVGVKDAEEEALDRKTNVMGSPGYRKSEYMYISDIIYEKLGEGDSSLSLKNDFNKVKSFDLRGVTKTEEN
ncbi:PREDICTED: uncharacterized protein LOC104770595 [Camelina sativa]|uniref:Uncharacterized protein LOC104770593 n=1 Tax=Camelina sativa TaxID=90675 RepID=A0ABM0XZT2_CAMSA|nr:PREDICTED: uncharacterized protein LOC104770593 [Camelina sativa]XP_010493347.1 PREDICTED: uncharacterized protein LOC104770595 [Camelina sativa]